MGYESDYQITSAVGCEEEFIASLGPSIDECASLNILSRTDSLNYMIPKVCCVKLTL